MTPRDASRSLNVQVLQSTSIEFPKPADKPSRAERVATWARTMDTTSASLLSSWLRIFSFVVSILGLVVLVRLIFWPESISPVTLGLIQLIISSGLGFTIPAVVLVAVLPRLMRLFAALPSLPTCVRHGARKELE